MRRMVKNGEVLVRRCRVQKAVNQNVESRKRVQRTSVNEEKVGKESPFILSVVSWSSELESSRPAVIAWAS
jgi:hypothetical protein